MQPGSLRSVGRVLVFALAMWVNSHSPQVPHEVAGVVVLVCRHVSRPFLTLRSLPFSWAPTSRSAVPVAGEIGLDDEAVAVLGEQMTGIGQAGGCPGRVLASRASGSVVEAWVLLVRFSRGSQRKGCGRGRLLRRLARWGSGLLPPGPSPPALSAAVLTLGPFLFGPEALSGRRPPPRACRPG